MTKPGASPKAAEDAKWAAEKQRAADEKQAKADRQKYLSTSIKTADKNKDAPETVLRQRKRQDALLKLELAAKRAKGLARVQAELELVVLKAKYGAKDLLTDTTLVDKSEKGDWTPKIRAASKHQEQARKKESGLQATRDDGTKGYSDKARAAGKVFKLTVFEIDIPTLWAEDGGKPLPFAIGPGWSTWTKTMETSELGYEELESDGWTQLKVQRHLEKAITPELRGKFFPWLQDELKKTPVDEDLVKKRWETLCAKWTKDVNTAAIAYIGEQIKKRKDANAALTDFKIDSAVEVSKAVATVAATSAVAAASMGGASPFAVIAIIRAGLTIFNECVKQFADQAQTAAIVKGQLDAMWLQMGTAKEKLEEEYRRANFEGKPIPSSGRAAAATVIGQSVSNFLSSDLLPTIKNARTMTDAHGHKITGLKNTFDQLADIQKAFGRYKAQWSGGDPLAYVNSLPTKEVKALYASKITEPQLRAKLKKVVDEANQAEKLHVEKMKALVTTIKAANQLQKGFDESVKALEAKNPEWTNVAVALIDIAVSAGLGAGDIIHAADEVMDKQFAIASTCIELAEHVNDLRKEAKEAKEYKALVAATQKRALEMKKAFEELKAMATA